MEILMMLIVIVVAHVPPAKEVPKVEDDRQQRLEQMSQG